MSGYLIDGADRRYPPASATFVLSLPRIVGRYTRSRSELLVSFKLGFMNCLLCR